MTIYGEFKENANHRDKGSDFSPSLFFLASFHTYYFEPLLSDANYSNYSHILPFHLPFLS